MPASLGSSFAIAPGVAWRHLGDETAVYVTASFETHVLNDLGGLVMDALISIGAPCTSQALQDRIFAAPPGESGVAGDAEAVEGELALLLNQLLDLGVIAEHQS